jgi:hypothetical protein
VYIIKTENGVKRNIQDEMISYFKNSTKFVLATGSEISLFQLQEKEIVEEYIYEDIKPQSISKFVKNIKICDIYKISRSG